ncbi:MAG: hypothetical protein HY329_24740 [Chloroflexi bacterium]|nr:hypothetical protein [Chloroflexota bacterium]
MARLSRSLAAAALVVAATLVAVPWGSAGSSTAAGPTVRVFNLVGTGTAHPCTIPKTAAGTTRTDFCFTVPLFEFKNGSRQLVGTATDALADSSTVGSGLAVAGATTFFDVSGEGEFVSQEQTTVQPTTIDSSTVTHITGFIPSPGTKNIVKGPAPLPKRPAPYASRAPST